MPIARLRSGVGDDGAVRRRWLAVGALAAVVLVIGSLRPWDILDLFDNGPCADGTSGSEAPTADRDEYIGRNMALLERVPVPAIAERTEVRHHPQTRCAEGKGNIIGFTTSAKFTYPPDVGRCAISLPIEEGMRRAGWAVDADEQPTFERDGTTRLVRFAKDGPLVEIAFHPAEPAVVVGVNHNRSAGPRRLPNLPRFCTDSP